MGASRDALFSLNAIDSLPAAKGDNTDSHPLTQRMREGELLEKEGFGKNQSRELRVFSIETVKNRPGTEFMIYCIWLMRVDDQKRRNLPAAGRCEENRGSRIWNCIDNTKEERLWNNN